MGTPLTMLVFLGALSAASAAFAGDDCFVPMKDWQPREAVRSMAEAQGWTIRRIKVDDGCYEIRGHDAQGRAFEVTVDPATLAIVESEFEGDGDRDDGSGGKGRRGDGADGQRQPSGLVAPPSEGLPGNGATPSFQAD